MNIEWLKKIILQQNPSIDGLEEIQYILTFAGPEIQKLINILTGIMVISEEEKLREEAFLFVQKFKDLKEAIQKASDQREFNKIIIRNFNEEL